MNSNLTLIVETLKKEWPNLKSELNYSTPLDFMVAVILSAQATDKGVNKATPKLFARFRNAKDYVKASVSEIESYISSINYFHTKALRVKKACQVLIDNFSSKVPSNMEDLLKIPGIGRKSANVILQNIFQISQGVVVDTHVSRVSTRLDFSRNKTPEKIEEDLMKIFPKNLWQDISNLFVLHGRYTCTSRNPKCNKCTIYNYCNFAQKTKI